MTHSRAFVFVVVAMIGFAGCSSSESAENVDPPASCPASKHPEVVCGQLGQKDECVRYEGVCLRECTTDEANSAYCKGAPSGTCALGGFSVGEQGHCFKN